MLDYFDILKASSGVPVDDPWAMIWAQGMTGEKWPITTLTGSLPLTYESRTKHILQNYVLYGSENGAGVETENLWNLPQNKSATTFNDVVWSINNYAIQGAGTTSSPQGTDAILVRPGGTISRATNYVLLYEIKAQDGLQLPTGTYHAHGTALDEAYVHLIVGVVGSREYAGGAARRITLNSDFVVNEDEYVVLLFSTSTAVATYGLSDFMITKVGSAPTAYIPFGYKIPLTNTGENSQSETYPLYIGSTKLGAEEYLDYEAGKIYKMVSGVLTPTDPPAPFPAINTYKGENTLSSTETVGEVEITGRIKEASQ